MTSGAIVKRRVRLRRVHVRTGSLLLLVVGIIVLLVTRSVVFPKGTSPTAGTGTPQSWRHTFIQRLFGNGELEDDDFHLNVPFYEEPLINRNQAQQSVQKTTRLPHLEYCTEAEYLDGGWTKREEPVTPDNIRRVFKLTDKARFQCPAKDAPPDDQVSPDDPAAWSRIWETAQWEWTPNSGCKKHDWSRWNFAKYCLRAKAGCT